MTAMSFKVNMITSKENESNRAQNHIFTNLPYDYEIDYKKNNYMIR